MAPTQQGGYSGNCHPAMRAAPIVAMFRAASSQSPAERKEAEAFLAVQLQPQGRCALAQASLLVAADDLQEESVRLQAAIALRKAVRELTGAESEGRSDIDVVMPAGCGAVEVLDAYLRCDGAAAVARQLEVALYPVFFVSPQTWAVVVERMNTLLCMSREGSPCVERIARGVRALQRLLAAATGREDDGWDPVRDLADACLRMVLDLGERMLLDLHDLRLQADMMGTICKTHMRLISALRAYDPAFESGNELPASLLNSRWPRILVAASQLRQMPSKSRAILGTEEVSFTDDTLVTRAEKWALRCLNEWFEVRRAASLDKEDPTRKALLVAAAAVVEPSFVAVATSHLGSSNATIEELALRVLRRCVEDSEVCAWVGPPARVLTALTPALAVREDDANDWEGDQAAIVRSECTAEVQLESPEEEFSLISCPRREAVYALGALQRRWPAEVRAFSIRCIEALAGNADALEAVAFFGNCWRGTLFFLGQEQHTIYLAMYFVQLLSEKPDSAFTENQHLLPALQVLLKATLRLQNPVMRHRALHLLRRIAWWWPVGTNSCLPPHELSSKVLPLVAPLLCDSELAVRHAAVGTCAAWIHTNTAELSSYVESALVCALQCAEDLADHDLVAEDIALLCRRCSGNAHALSSLESTLNKLLVALNNAPDVDACQSTLGAVAVLARHLQTCGQGKAVLLKLAPLLSTIMTCQDKFIRHHGPTLEALDACLAANAFTVPGKSALFAALFHLVCGGVSADWPVLDDESYSGVKLDSAKTYASVLCHLMGPMGESCGDSLSWTYTDSEGLGFAEMAVGSARRLFGSPQVSRNGGIQDVQPTSHEATAETCAAAASIVECLFRVCDDGTRRRCMVPALEGALCALGGSGRDVPRIRVLVIALQVDASCALQFLASNGMLPRAYALLYTAFAVQAALLPGSLEALAALLPASREAHNGNQSLDAFLAKIVAAAVMRLLDRGNGPGGSSRKRKRDEDEEDLPVGPPVNEAVAAITLGRALAAEPPDRVQMLMNGLPQTEIAAFAQCVGG